MTDFPKTEQLDSGVAQETYGWWDYVRKYTFSAMFKEPRQWSSLFISGQFQLTHQEEWA